jgi:hypothetical protein
MLHALPHGLAVLVLLPLLSGCSTLLTVAYLVRPHDVPAEFAGLKGSHVAIVCRPIVELEFSDAGSARELTNVVDQQLRQRIRGINVIGQHEVARWLDENSWVDYPALGKAIDADYVVGIDLEQFRLFEGSTLYRGRAAVTVRVFEVKTGEVVFQKRIDKYEFPANGAIPTSDRSESEFRTMFLTMLGQRIARSFYAYESRDVFAEESLTF